MSSQARALVKELSPIRRWPVYLLALAIILVALGFGCLKVSSAAFRDNFDVFSQIMISPLGLIIPILVVLVGCIGLSRDLGNRFIANTRSRVDVRNYVMTKLMAAIVLSFATFFLLAVGAAVIAFSVWPALGNPSVDPSVYRMTETQAAADSLVRTSYSSLLVLGPFWYSVIYATWLGLGAATYASLGIAALLLVHNRVLALTLPFLLYFGQTLIASLLGAPQSSLLYSLLPFGLTQAPLLEAAGPTLLLFVASIILWITLYPRLKFLPRLS